MKTAVVAALLAAACAGSAVSQTLSPAEVLAQAQAYSYELRQGRYEVAPKSMALVERALEADPDNAKLLTAYAIANFQMATASAQKGGNPAAAFPALQKGAAAYEKAAPLDPTNADALAGRGAARSLLGAMQGKPELIAQGMADMDRAVALSPQTATPRLQRAFFGLNAPAALRNEANTVTDLKQLIAWGTPRERDHLHLLLGDLYAEAGKPDLAMAEYRAAARAGSTADAMARSRIATGGKVDAATIAGLRSQIGSNCAMCHAD